MDSAGNDKPCDTQKIELVFLSLGVDKLIGVSTNTVSMDVTVDVHVALGCDAASVKMVFSV